MSDYVSVLCGVIKNTLKERDAEQACRLVEWGIPVIPYHTIISKKGEKQVVPALGKYKEWLYQETTSNFWQWLVNQWEYAEKNTKICGWVIFLGPLGQYTIMLDFDSDEIKELFDNNRDEWWKKAKTVAELLAHWFTVPIERRNGINVVTNSSILIATRRGAHVIIKLGKSDWEKLHSIIKSNKKLGTVEVPPVPGSVEARGELELRTLGPTPLSSFKHKIVKLSKLYPFSISKVEETLKWLGLSLPEPTPITSYNRNRSRETNHQTTAITESNTSTPTTGTSQVTSAYDNNQPLDGKRLNEQNINRIVELVVQYWVPGHRNNLELALLGWIIKRGIARDSVKELIKRIAERAGDEELDKRLSEVDRHYRLIASGEKDVKELLGKSGLLYELQTIIKSQNPGLSDEEARDRAIAVVAELEQVLGPPRTILVRTPYKTNTWIVNDPRRGIVLLKEKRDENGEVRRAREYISDWYIKGVLVVRSEGQYYYKVLFKNARTGERLVLSGQLDEIARELKRVHGVKRSQVVGDAVSAIVSELIRRRVARIKKTAEVAGILPVSDGKVNLVRVGALSKLLTPREPDLEKAKQALELLQRLRKHYNTEKFDVVINWATYAPASYALKKLFHIKQVFLMLHGEKQTGKTTLGRMVTSMYPTVTSDEEEIVEEAQSEYRLAWKLNISTLPALEDEVQGISKKIGLLGLLKRAASGDVVRWRGDTSRRYHARTPLIMTSNYRELLEDPALVERIIQVEFTHDDHVYRKPKEELEEFKRLYNEYKSVAPHLGALILNTIVLRWDEICEKWIYRITEKQDYIQFGQWLWRRVAERLGIEPPEWAVNDVKIEEENPDDVIVATFWDTLHDILAEQARLFKCEESIAGCLAKLGERGLLPNSIFDWTRQYLIVKAGIKKEIECRVGVDIGSLRNLAEKLGLEYKSVRVKGKVVKGVVVPISTLIKRIGGEEDIVDYLANTLLFKYIMEGWGTHKTPVLPRVIEEARRLGIEIDKETAERVADKLFMLGNKQAVENELLEEEVAV